MVAEIFPLEGAEVLW